jgi:hypothetical protein
VPDELPRWRRLHRGLVQASHLVTLVDLSSFQRWVPRVRRFSYVLSPGAGFADVRQKA